MKQKEIEVIIPEKYKKNNCLGNYQEAQDIYKKSTINSNLKFINKNNNTKYIFIFPENIRFLSKGFVNGFFKDILGYIDREDLFNYIEIKGHSNIKKYIKEGLRT